jgi:hypothetical protein
MTGPKILHRVGLGGGKRPETLDEIRERNERWKPEDARQEIKQILSVLVVPFLNRTCTEEELRQSVDAAFAEKVPQWRICFGAKAVTEALASLNLQRFDT